MNILHTNFHKGWGGQSNRILVVSKGLARRGHAVALAVPRDSELARRGREAGLDVYDHFYFARGMRPQFLAHDIGALRALTIKGRIDILHTHGSQDSWAAALALLGLKRRPIVLRTKHNIFPIRDHWPNRWLYGKRTDGIICISRAILEYCAAKPYLRRENLDLAHSAVNAECFRLPRDRSVLREFGLAGRYVAGIVGRLRPEKGHRHLFEALPKVIQAKPDFALLAVGSGSLEGELMALAGRLGLERHVRFAGFRTDVPRILNALDLFVMPSISEGLGTAALEAGAAGLPIVASREGGITDIITDGEHGLLAPPGDAPALAEAIVRMTLDRDLAARCAHAVRQRVCAEFSEEALVEKNDAIYRAWFERRALIAG